MKKILKKASVVALSTAVAASAVTPALAAKSPVKGLRPVKRTVTMKASKGVKITYKTTTKGTASISKVSTKNKTVTIKTTVKINGVTYKVKTVSKSAFAKAKGVKTIIVSGTDIKFAKGAFKGLKTQKIKLVISKKVSKKQLKAYTSAARKAGFKGKVSVAKPKPVKRTVTVNAAKGVKITYKTTTKGTASIAKVPTKNKTVTISSKVKIKGVTYKASTVNKNVFTSARRLKTIKVNSTGIKFAKGAFSGLNTKSMKLVITKKVSRKQLKAYKASVKKAGFKGKVVVG